MNSLHSLFHVGGKVLLIDVPFTCLEVEAGWPSGSTPADSLLLVDPGLSSPV